MRPTIRSTALLIATVLFVCPVAFGLQISQIEFDLHLASGANGTYAFQVINNESAPQQVTVYLSDWTRTQTGDNDFVPLDGARWLFDRTFEAGDELDLLYKIPLLAEPLTVSGDFMTADPASHGTIVGPGALSSDDIGRPVSQTSPAGPVSVSRQVVSQDSTSHTLTVRLQVLFRQAVNGLRIDEVFSHHVTVTNVKDGGAEFTAVSRSNGDWITVSPQRFQIDPGKTQEVTFSIHVPTGAAGTTWGMIFVEGSPRAQQREGATVLAVERFGVKVYETVPGTENYAGRVVGVSVLKEDPLTVRIAFENTGNIQLRPKGKIDIISQTGDVVRSLPLGPFPVLPGATRDLTVTDPSSTPLGAGIYRALVTIDYGGQALAGGTRDFRVK